MTSRHPRVAEAARRLLPPLLIFAIVASLVLLLESLGVRLRDAKADKDYGGFAVGMAGALLLTRLLGFVLFDLAFRLRRGAPAPALLRQLVDLLVFGLLLGTLAKVLLAANLTLLLTSSAIITAVLGLALQETLGNLFSGLALALERTVQVGDVVRSGETIGLVEQLSWRAIKVRTMEGSSILIPNSMASRERLEVFRRSGLPMARILHVGLEYETPPGLARAALESAPRDVRGVASHPAPIAYVARFDDHALAYELRYWLEDYARFLEIDSKVRERVWYKLHREGLRIAYPLVRQHQYAGGPLILPSDADAVQDAITASDLFAPLTSAERQKLAGGARPRRFGDGEIVVHEGDTTSSMFLVAEGQVGVSVRAGGSESQKLAILEPGMAFGEISLLTGEPRTATVRAVTEATLIEIDKATLAPILEANPSLVEKLDSIILERRRQTADRLGSGRESQSTSPPVSLRSRIARFFGLAGDS